VGADEKDPQVVVTDSTVIYSDPRLRRAYFRLIRKHAAAGRFQIAVPEIVVQECAKKFEVRSEDAYSRMQKHAAVIETLGLPTVIPDEATREAAVRDYESEFRQTLAEPGCRVAPIPEVPHSELVPKAVAKSKPFGPKGTGYRDALIWETVLEEAKAARVAFITNNTDDFCNQDATALADDLLGQLRPLGLPRHRITWYPDLKSFIEAEIPAIDRVLEEARDRTANDQIFKSSMFDLISIAANALALSDQWENGGTQRTLGLPSDASEPTVDMFEVEEVRVEDAYEGDDGEVVLDLLARGDAEVEFFLPKWDVFAEDEDYWIVDGNWNEWVALVTATRPIELSVTISYDPETRELSNPDITSWVGVSDE
jgi:hypothetical protein